MQAFAYASLAFSLLAAFGAVLGKQWLSYYKTNRYVRGSLEERCKQRHRKFQGLETWKFEHVLQTFPDLLKISLFLFGLSLGSAMWSHQQTIFILIITTTGCGFLCYALTIIAAIKYPDCPFQTRIPSLIRTIISPNRQPDAVSTESAMEWLLETSTNPDVIRSALELLPKLSKTHVDLVSLSKRVRDMFKACFDLDGNATLGDSALAYGKALVHLSWTTPGAKAIISEGTKDWNNWKSWRELYLPWALKHCQTSHHRMSNASSVTLPQHQETTRSALRMTVAAGLDVFDDPNDLKLVWDGQFHVKLSVELPGVNWLMDCAEHFYDIGDVDVAGDALLLLSGNLDKPSWLAIRDRLTPFLNTSSQRLRHIALRAALWVLDYTDSFEYCNQSFSHAILKAITYSSSDKRGIQVNDAVLRMYRDSVRVLNFTEWPNGSDLEPSPLSNIQLLVLLVLPVPRTGSLEIYIPYCKGLARHMGGDHRLQATILNKVCSIRQDLLRLVAVAGPQALRDIVLRWKVSETLLKIFYPTGPEMSFNADHDSDYLRFIFALAKNADCGFDYFKLRRDRLIERCITIIQHNWSQHDGYSKIPSTCLFYLAGILLHVAPQCPSASYFEVTNAQWWDLMRGAWNAFDDYDRLQGGDEVLAALVTGTEMSIPHHPSLSKEDLKSFEESLGKALDKLMRQDAEPDKNAMSEVARLKAKIHSRWQ